MFNYIDLISNKSNTDFLHYYNVSMTQKDLDNFYESFQDLELNDEDNFILGRFRKKQIAKSINFNAEKSTLNYMSQEIYYPEGTTHIYCGLYHDDDFTSFYLAERDYPCAVKIDGDKWYVYKRIDDIDSWVELVDILKDKINLHDINHFVNYEADDLYPEPYILDKILEELDNEIFHDILSLYSHLLSEFFENNLDIDTIIKAFSDNKVFHVDDEDQDPDGIYLNRLLKNVVSSKSFIDLYNKHKGF